MSNSLLRLLLYFGVSVLNFNINNCGFSLNALFENWFALIISSGYSLSLIKYCLLFRWCAVSKCVIVYSLFGSNIVSNLFALDALNGGSFCKVILFSF